MIKTDIYHGLSFYSRKISVTAFYPHVQCFVCFLDVLEHVNNTNCVCCKIVKRPSVALFHGPSRIQFLVSRSLNWMGGKQQRYHYPHIQLFIVSFLVCLQYEKLAIWGLVLFPGMRPTQRTWPGTETLKSWACNIEYIKANHSIVWRAGLYGWTTDGALLLE